MCSPEVLAKVQQEISRRRLLGVGMAGLVAGGAMLQSRHVTAAQDATPESSPMPDAVSEPLIAYLPAGLSSVVDLTYTATPDFPLYPGTPPFTIVNHANVPNDGYYSNNLSFNEHTATHMDAPAHFIADGATADLIPVQQLIAPLAVVDISAKAATDPDASVTVEDLTAWETANGPLPEGAFVAMYSGWGAQLAISPEAYLNIDTEGVQHYPGFSPEASAFLVSERNITGAGVDTLSLDPGNSVAFESHVNFLGAGKYGVENLMNLETLPVTGAFIFVGGPKTLGASGGMTRAIAVY